MIFKLHIIIEMINFIKNSLRCCCHCQASFVSVDVLCSDCWSRLFKSSISGVRWLYSEKNSNYIQVRYLIDWNQDNDALVESLIYALKGGRQMRAFLSLAEKMAINSIKRNQSGVKKIFIPAPSHTEKPDHASRLAEKLAKFFGSQYYQILQNQNSLSQKHLGLNERKKTKLILQKQLDFNDQSIIFVDDVVTTGSTIMAAYRAMGYPRNFSAWVIANKEKMY